MYHCHESVAVKAMSGQACNHDTEPHACHHSTWETEARRTVSVFQSDLGHVLNEPQAWHSCTVKPLLQN